jgi:hypothetical protein
VPSCGAAEQFLRWTGRTAYDLSNRENNAQPFIRQRSYYTPAIVPRHGGTCFCRRVAHGSKPLPSQRGESNCAAHSWKVCRRNFGQLHRNAPNVADHWLRSPGYPTVLFDLGGLLIAVALGAKGSDQSRNYHEITRIAGRAVGGIAPRSLAPLADVVAGKQSARLFWLLI